MKIGAVRQCIHDALTWADQQRTEMGMLEWMRYQCRIERSFKANAWATVDFLEVGWILAAINAQRAPVRAWLRYAYGEENNQSDLETVASDVYLDNFIDFHPIERHKALCKCAVDDYRLRLRRMKDMPVDAYAHHMGMPTKNWIRDYDKKKDVCLDRVKLFDSEGVANVSIVVRQLRGEGDFPSLADALKEAS
jgi:hypothetical protein